MYAYELEGLKKLVAEERGIKKPGGIEYCSNLVKLDLAGNDISDLHPLPGLIRLAYLDLYRNKIEETSALFRLANLKMLSIGENQVTGISGFSRMEQLVFLMSATTNWMIFLQSPGCLVWCCWVLYTI